MNTARELTAPCGIDCFNCTFFVDNITDQAKMMFAQHFKLDPEKVPCKGCRAEQGCRLHFSDCATLDCVRDKGVDFCFECEGFPCSKLQPAFDGADRYPHNLKLYNLCRMKAIGVEQWAEQEALTIRNKYFKGKFVVGVGPVLE